MEIPAQDLMCNQTHIAILSQLAEPALLSNEHYMLSFNLTNAAGNTHSNMINLSKFYETLKASYASKQRARACFPYVSIRNVRKHALAFLIK